MKHKIFLILSAALTLISCFDVREGLNIWAAIAIFYIFRYGAKAIIKPHYQEYTAHVVYGALALCITFLLYINPVNHTHYNMLMTMLTLGCIAYHFYPLRDSSHDYTP